MGAYDDLDFEEVEVTGGGWFKFANVGDAVTGTVVQLDTGSGTTFDGDPCPELLLQTDDGELVRVTQDKGALRDAITAARLQVDDVAKVQRQSDKTSAAGRDYQTFKVYVARGAGKPKLSADEEAF